MTVYYTNRTDSWVIAIDGNVVTGETFAAKETIKNMLGGRWNAEGKFWTIDTNKLPEALSNPIRGLYTASDAQIAKLQGTSVAAPTSSFASRPTKVQPRANAFDNARHTWRSAMAYTDNSDKGAGWCDRCGSYCYGDCTAN